MTFTNDKSVAIAQLLLSMLGAIYQFERTVLPERQKEDIDIARAKGKYKGRPKSISPAPILQLLHGGLSMRKTADWLGISLSTVQRVKMENHLVVGVKDRLLVKW